MAAKEKSINKGSKKIATESHHWSLNACPLLVMWSTLQNFSILATNLYSATTIYKGWKKYPIGLLQTLNWIIFVNSSAQYLKHNNCSINGSYHVTEKNQKYTSISLLKSTSHF